jgi:hypothetical protein
MRATEHRTGSFCFSKVYVPHIFRDSELEWHPILQLPCYIPVHVAVWSRAGQFMPGREDCGTTNTDQESRTTCNAGPSGGAACRIAAGAKAENAEATVTAAIVRAGPGQAQSGPLLPRYAKIGAASTLEAAP